MMPVYQFSQMDDDDMEELLDPARREGAYFSAFDGEGALVGFFQFEREGETIDIGLGLRPDLTGQGLGLEYLLAGLGFAGERFSPGRFTLSVATFNERAIEVYERAGFRRGAVYTHHTNGADFQFLAMAREV